MNYAQISAFDAVMTSASLTEAAQKLGRTQPAVSAAIKSLEDQLGLKLFERRGRKMIPVPEAQYLLAEVSAILTQMARVRNTIRGLADGQSGSLNVAAMPGPVSMLFPGFVAKQIGDAADTKISMFARSSNQIAELARAQSIDFGFADLPDSHGGDVLYRAQVISGNCFVALPTHHPRAVQASIGFEDLSAEPLGSLQAGHAHQRELRAAFEARDLNFSTRIESQTFLPILQFVMAGQCCAILDPLTVVHVNKASEMKDTIAIRPLDEAIRYSYAILWPRHRPISRLAEQTRDAWSDEVMRILSDVGAEPTRADLD